MNIRVLETLSVASQLTISGIPESEVGPLLGRTHRAVADSDGGVTLAPGGGSPSWSLPPGTFTVVPTVPVPVEPEDPKPKTQNR